MGFLEKDFKAQNIWCPPILHDVLQPYARLIQHECSSLKGFCDGNIFLANFERSIRLTENYPAPG